MLSTCRTAASLAAVAAMIAGASGASAQGLSGFTVSTQWEAGGTVLAFPKYDGASKYRAIGFPVIFPSGPESRIDVKNADDVRIRLLSFQGFEIGPVAGWRFGRDESDGRLLRGLGDIDGGLALGGYTAYRFGGGLSAFVSYSHQVTGDDTGDLVRFGLESKLPIQNWMTLTAVVSATWANEDYMRTFFGVSTMQAAQSGHAVYSAGSGIKDVHVGLTAEIPMTDLWTLRLMGRYAQLVGDAADSPVVEREGQLSGGIGLTYKFSLGR